ncbi:DUF2971 domain-containing protein [Haladaptatus cibarius]|uniref:DUF2971 domain-containing protein n=1 Tax=Haladaptatus cibarius TaxID=453847 RepID=UPI000678E37D|nr:DUF2971 domain-containing protein [Haladaptatus cibarius]
MRLVEPRQWNGEEWVDLFQDEWRPPQPSSDEQLWRYRSLGQYVTFLDREELWFSRADQFDDPYEGSLPRLNVEKRDMEFEKVRSEGMKRAIEGSRYFSFLNCWHMNNHESDAMWRMYTENNGVAIITNPMNLKNAIESEKDILSGKVEYADYENEIIPDGNTISPYYYKREGFRHEHEYRLFFQESSDPSKETKSMIEILQSQETGIPISVDPDTLVEKVLVAPTAPSWLEETVRSVTRKYGYDFDVSPSKMDGEPLF